MPDVVSVGPTRRAVTTGKPAPAVAHDECTPLRPYQKAFFIGAKNTVELALVGEIGGIIIGLTLAMFILSSRRVVRAPARIYINFFRGTPLIWAAARASCTSRPSS